MAALIVLLAAPFAAALACALMPDGARRASAWLSGLVALAGAAWTAMQFPALAQGEVLAWSQPWMPSVGLTLSLRMDGLAWLFALLVFAIGALVVLYAAMYLAEDEPLPRFYGLLMAFMGAMLGVVLAGNLMLLVVAWELTSLTSFLLIGWWRQEPEARRGARMALTITGAGGLCLMAGMFLLGRIVGSHELDDVLAARDVVAAHPLAGIATALIVLGALTKSAQLPFHVWLPNAMAAPTPVSAYLHSATLVKAGVFLLARLWPVLSGSEVWFWMVSGAGLATLLVGAFVAMFQQDLKGLLAYSTISHLGLITLLFGLGSPLAAVAGVFHVMNHATFKASLFMAAGIIDHEAGSRDLRKLNGLFRLMPMTATLAMVASAAMAGVPLLNGFLSKEMFFAETLALEGHGLLRVAVPALATLAGLFSVAYSLRFIHDVFFNGEPAGLPRTPHEPPWAMRLPVELLVLLCLVVGVAPALTVEPLLALAAAPVTGGALPEFDLAIWHGLNTPLAMSAIALAGGVALYVGLQRRVNLHTVDVTPVLHRVDARRRFEALLGAVRAAAGRLGGPLAPGRLQPQLAVLFAVTVIAAAVPAWVHPPGLDEASRRAATPLPAVALIVGLIGMACAVAGTVLHRRRLAALMLLGGTGLVVSLAFAWLSAPDLALTQLLVEMVSVLLVMLALRWLPVKAPTPAQERVERAQRVPTLAGRDAAGSAVALALAVAGGAGMAWLAWAMMTRPETSVLAGYFLEQSRTGGGGSNVVNVIIVDFRGFDTLGEASVMAAAALIVAALLERFEGRPQSGLAPGPFAGRSVLLPAAMRALWPAIAMLAVFFLLRGHDLPGGGFIAGLVLSLAFLLQYMADGFAGADRRLALSPTRWIAAGLAVAVTTGAGAWAFGRPYLTSAHGHPTVPLLGEVPLASAMAFDFGVFLVVVGATLRALRSIARPGMEVPR